MRVSVCLGLAILLLTGIIGCGGNPVDAIIADEKAWENDRKSGEVDQMVLAKRQEEITKKIANLSVDQKKEYEHRHVKEFPGSATPGSGKGGRGGKG
ncbi:MAG: hypothetical protein HY040_28295 [Planctomycetes bacterium]|nr:hypothetical protein [Planctomycetota bacterium]